MQFSDLRQTEEKALLLFERLGKKAVLAAAAALLLLSVGLFLLMRGVELLLMPAPVMTQKTEVSAAERLVEPPSRFLTTEERINIISIRLTDSIAGLWHKSKLEARTIVDEAVRLGKQFDLDPLLILSVISVESGFNERAVSKAGAVGLMQVHVPAHGKKFEDHGGKEALFDVRANMTVGAEILANYLTKQGTVKKALKYYVGAANLRGDGSYSRRVFVAQSRLLLAAEGEVERAKVLTLRKKAGPSYRILAGKPGTWSDFLALVRKVKTC